MYVINFDYKSCIYRLCFTLKFALSLWPWADVLIDLGTIYTEGVLCDQTNDVCHNFWPTAIMCSILPTATTASYHVWSGIFMSLQIPD